MDKTEAERQRLQKALGFRGDRTLNAQSIRAYLAVYEIKALQKGKAEATVMNRAYMLERLAKKANLNDPYEVWEVIDKHQSWGEATKKYVALAYKSFCRIFEIGIPRDLDFCKWIPPDSLPFIPLEKEIDALISGCNRKTAALLQLLKETAMRIGEAWNLKYSNLDFKTRIVTLNNPEKRSKARQFRLSEHLIAMLKALPREPYSPDNLFLGRYKSFRANFLYQRRKIATKLQNPRILRIHFHTFRHWKATMEYHKTKSLLHVQKLLGHRDINSTLIYTHLIDFKGEDYYSATAKTVEEAKKLIEKGFEYVCEFDSDTDGVKLFRKRK